MVELLGVSEAALGNEDDLTGGDIDDNSYLAEVSGEEAIGGSAPTPDQSNVDENAHAVGVELSDSETIRMRDKLEARDEHRWELDPDSSEDEEDE
ncbi:hypothetical protein H6G50_04420 [Oscillatoria sp. FACHB-1406]|nr:hypothetical protein [Oscillatoria sp. FACHB-1406]